jgi:aspartyl-tRNA(Asn)/glutamyl-tRNA(Gln) amidotransferase subunit A
LRLATRRLEQEGFRLRKVALPKSALSLDVMWTIASADIAEYYRTDLQNRAGDFCPQVRRNLIAGSMIPAVDYIRARRLQRQIRRQMAEVFSAVDVVLMPSMAIAPYPSGAERVNLGGKEYDVLPAIMQFTPLANVSGYPAMIVPVDGAADGPPPTIQLYGRPYEESALMTIETTLRKTTTLIGAR